jgi:hypothetical protein
MRISDTILDIITALRTAIELDDTSHTTSMTRELSRLPEFEGSTATAGYHVSPEGDIKDDHWWLIMDDGSVFDADADEPTRCSKKDSRHGRYFPYTGETGIPVEVLQAADHLRASSRVAKNKSFTDMVGEASGASAPSAAPRQAPEALPDAMTMDGQEGMVVDEFDDETKPEDLQMGWKDLVGEDEAAAIDIDEYSCGKCMWLALALNQKYGWDIRAQIHHDAMNGDYVAHAYNILPNGKEVDVLGVQDQVDIFSTDETRDMTADEMFDFLGVDPDSTEVKKHLQAAAGIIDTHMNLKEVDHPEYMPGGENGTDNYDPTYDERSVHTNAGWPRP